MKAQRQFRLHPVLWIIYHCVRVLAWLSVHVFYKKRTIIGQKNLTIEGAAIVIANHPSTLLDVFNVGTQIRRTMFFLANYGLFKHPVSNWVFSRLYCIPVKRKEDVTEGEERNNDAAFVASFEHLEKGGILFIAPEGVSFMNRWVRPLKTGTARIALATEKRNNGLLDLKIIPAGVSYDAPNLFRSQVVVHVGEPISVQNWVENYQGTPEEAADAFTNYLEDVLRSLTIDARDEQGETFINQAEELLKNEKVLPQTEAYFQSKQILESHLDNFSLQIDTDNYFKHLKSLGLKDIGFAQNERKFSVFYLIWEVLIGIVGIPLAVLANAFWFFPCFVPWWVAKKMKLYIGYDSNVKIIVGLFTLPLMCWVAYRFGLHLFENPMTSLFFVGYLVLLGFFLEYYEYIISRMLARLKVIFFKIKMPEKYQEFTKERIRLLRQIY
jgi:glycerol-3-phosphate O-acyltransferase / dihydroxyacetone phosphate acyltransferase